MVSRSTRRLEDVAKPRRVPRRGDELGVPTRRVYVPGFWSRRWTPPRGKNKSRPLRDHPDVAHSASSVRSTTPSHYARMAAKFKASHFPGEYLYCFSQTVTLLKADT